jgi:uncharacterized membrane protein
MRFLRTLPLAAVGAAAMISSAMAATLVPVPNVPNSKKTAVYAINDNNVVAGSYLGTDKVEHAFFGPLGTYSTFTAGQHGTVARSINNAGYIAGFANSEGGITSQEAMFIRKPGGARLAISGLVGRAQGINNNNRFVGTYWDFSDFEAVGFVGQRYQYKHDVVVPVVHQASDAAGINDNGDVVGSIFSPPERGFIRSGNVVFIVDYPSRAAQGTTLEGVNNLGQAVGNWFDDKGRPHAFMLEYGRGTFTDIEVPSARNVKAWSVNNNGAVAVSTNIGSFIWCEFDFACPAPGAHVNAPVHMSPKPLARLGK